MTSRGQSLKAFLSRGEFPERGTGRPDAVAIAGLTSSLSGAGRHYFHNGSSFHRILACAKTGLLRKSCRPFTREARRLPRSIASAARFVLDLWIGVTAAWSKPGCGRSRTLTGQCQWSLCPGDSINHSDGLHVVTKYRRQRGGLVPRGFRRLGSLAHHPSRNMTPPGLSSPGPSVAVCYLPTLAAYLGNTKFE
jgi:hypothetical protein